MPYRQRARRLGWAAVAAFILTTGSGGLYVLRVVSNAETAADHANQAATDARALAQQAVDEVLASREIGYQGRAQVCRIQVLLGATPSGACLDPNVLRYYDQTEERPTPAFACDLYVALSMSAPEDCEGP